jgi:hypothetical protein
VLLHFPAEVLLHKVERWCYGGRKKEGTGVERQQINLLENPEDPSRPKVLLWLLGEWGLLGAQGTVFMA